MIIFPLKTLPASKLCCASIILGSACYLALLFALSLLGWCICSFISDPSITCLACLTLLEGGCCKEPPRHFGVLCAPVVPASCIPQQWVPGPCAGPSKAARITYSYPNALLTWGLFCSSQNGFKNPVPRAFLCAGV